MKVRGGAWPLAAPASAPQIGPQPCLLVPVKLLMEPVPVALQGVCWETWGGIGLMTFISGHHSVATETSHSSLPSAACSSPFYKLPQIREITATWPSPHHGGKKCEWTGRSQDHGKPPGPSLGGTVKFTLDSGLPWSDIRMAPMP